MSGSEVSPATADAVDLFGRLRSLAGEAAMVRSAEDVRGRFLLAVLAATGAFAGSFALVDGDDVQVFSASGYRPELLAEFGRFPLDAPVPLAEAARTGETIVMADARAWVERYPNLESVAEHPGIAIPLSAAGKRVGAVGLSFDVSHRFDPTEMAFLAAVGAHVAAVIETAAHEIDRRRLLARHRAAERVVRASLLPARIPTIRGWQVAARYQPAAGDLGGDFYDFIPLPAGGWAVVIGDVQGRGPEAAIAGALARQALRDATATFDSPAAMLGHLNAAILAGLDAAAGAPGGGEPGVDEPRFVTVAALTIGPAATADRRVQLALAGHPQPLHGHAAAGRVVPVGTPGGLLGLLPGPALTDATARLAPGDVLVLFTDGLVERHHGNRFFDEDAVVPIVAANLHRSAERIADAVIAAARDFAGTGPSDDTAVVVLRAVPEMIPDWVRREADG